MGLSSIIVRTSGLLLPESKVTRVRVCSCVAANSSCALRIVLIVSLMPDSVAFLRWLIEPLSSTIIRLWILALLPFVVPSSEAIPAAVPSASLSLADAFSIEAVC